MTERTARRVARGRGGALAGRGGGAQAWASRAGPARRREGRRGQRGVGPLEAKERTTTAAARGERTHNCGCRVGCESRGGAGLVGVQHRGCVGERSEAWSGTRRRPLGGGDGDHLSRSFSSTALSPVLATAWTSTCCASSPSPATARSPHRSLISPLSSSRLAPNGSWSSSSAPPLRACPRTADRHARRAPAALTCARASRALAAQASRLAPPSPRGSPQRRSRPLQPLTASPRRSLAPPVVTSASTLSPLCACSA